MAGAAAGWLPGNFYNERSVMAESYSPLAPWVLFRLNNQIYGIPASSTQEMVSIPEITPIPRAPEYVRGLINLRGSVLALIDLRLKLGQPSMTEEIDSFIASMRLREQEHADWLDALQHTIDTGEPFTKARNPHECAFGKWYDGYHTDNPQLTGLFLLFDAPHRAIHASADMVDEQLRHGHKDKANELLQQVRGKHETLLHTLFNDMESALRAISQEVAIVVEHEGNVLAIIVDAVESVETMAPDSIEELPGNHGEERKYIVSMLGRRSSDNSPVLIPDLGRVISEAVQDTAALNMPSGEEG